MLQADILLPVFNPPRDWEKTVSERFIGLQARFPDLQLTLILINDGSTLPGIVETMARLNTMIASLSWITYPVNQGKGFALRKGVEAAKGDLIVYTDVDWPYTEESMVNLIRVLLEGHAVAVGVREEDYYRHLPALRRWISKSLKVLNQRLLRLPVPDTQAGLKGFRREVRSVFLATTIRRYLFDLEFIHLLSRQKDVHVEGVPVRLREGIRFSSMNRRILWQEGWNFIKIAFST